MERRPGTRPPPTPTSRSKKARAGRIRSETFFNARVWEGRVHYKPALATAPTGAVASETGASSSGVLSRAGTGVGTAVSTSPQVTLHEGVAVSGSFGAVGAVSVGEAAVVYDTCTP